MCRQSRRKQSPSIRKREEIGKPRHCYPGSQGFPTLCARKTASCLVKDGVQLPSRVETASYVSFCTMPSQRRCSSKGAQVLTSRENRTEDTRSEHGPVIFTTTSLKPWLKALNEACILIEEVGKKPDLKPEEPEEDVDDQANENHHELQIADRRRPPTMSEASLPAQSPLYRTVDTCTAGLVQGQVSAVERVRVREV